MSSYITRPLALVALVAVLLVAAPTRPGRVHAQGSELPYRLFAPMVAADSAGPTMDLAVYFFIDEVDGDGGPFLVPVHREVPETAGVARAALEAMLHGPTGEETSSTPAISSAVPAGTELLGISVAGGVATVDLSDDFESGGGSFSIRGRLAQLVFTLTRFPTVNSVLLQIEGETVDIFSSEGVVIDGPLTREDFLDFAPPILVDSPLYFGEGGNPLRVTGIANVFEATFMLTLTDNDGLILYEEPVMATCGTGCWGTFDVTVPYSVGSEQLGALIVWVASAQDGSMENIREYPAWLTPAD